MEKLRQILTGNPSFATALAAQFVAVIPGLFHIYWPLFITSFVAVFLFAPVPRALNSLLGKLLTGLLVVYAGLQLAALVQLFVFPHSGFATTSVLLALFVCVFLLALGKYTIQMPKLMRGRDWLALLACSFFIIGFLPFVASSNSMARFTELAGVQVVDGPHHWDITSDLNTSQNLDPRYAPRTVGVYYPAGFHYATAYFEDAFGLSGDQNSWSFNARMYFAQYAFFGIVLGLALVYFSYGLAERIYPEVKGWAYGAIALSVGASGTILFYLLFVSEGYLNYYYVCATILIGMNYLLEEREWLIPKRGKDSKRALLKALPLSMFLLLSYGASGSWPLLTPAILLTAALTLEYPNIRKWYGFTKANLAMISPVALLVLLHLMAVFAQVHYLPASGSLVNAGGAIQSFDILFLVIGVGLVFTHIYKDKTKSSGLLTALFAPFILLICGLMAYQFFTLGGASYYLIKVSLVFEMFVLALLSIDAVVLVKNVKNMNIFAQFFWPPLAVAFIVIASLGTMPQPFQEIRNLYRHASGIGAPLHEDSDSAAIADLGTHYILDHYNVTVLHYDLANHYDFAQIEPAVWANSVEASDGPAHAGKSDVAGLTCFTIQSNLLARGITSSAQQEELINAVQACATAANKYGLPYYVVTDPDSVTALEAQLGPSSRIIANE